jgi:co-chaperonin GroES (HSP10)
MTTTNNSGLHPQGVAVLCAPYEPEVKIWSDTLIIPDSVREALSVLENRQVVVEVGPSAWHDEPRPRAQPGDVVLVTKHAGFVATGADGRLYRLFNCREIFCVVDANLVEAAKSAKEKVA